jgi:hypothetical protein|tara:strand:- start:1832 stop:1951 length:120 start_codon:yes stop_codon:yes gene_type:complete
MLYMTDRPSYIGELMQTSKITSTGAGKAAKGKGKGRIIK